MADYTGKKFDTFAETTYLVRLAQDAKVFERKDGGEDVVLTFCDNSRVETTEDMWVDARVAKFQSDRAKLHKKGDEIQVKGKLRFKKQDDGTYRGKIYDAVVSSFVALSKRAGEATPGAEPNLFG
jgi:hypothetical protein